MHKFVYFSDKLLKEEIAYADCDIACGIYDPFRAQQAAQTIIRMTELLGKIDRTDEIKGEHDIDRCTRVKEKHGDIVEEELGTLQNNYFKEENIKEYPTISDLLNKTVKRSITARQSITMEADSQTLS